MNRTSTGPALICALAGLIFVTVGCATKKYAYQRFAQIENQVVDVSPQSELNSGAASATAAPVESTSIKKSKRKATKRSWDDGKSFLPPSIKYNWAARHQIPTGARFE